VIHLPGHLEAARFAKFPTVPSRANVSANSANFANSPSHRVEAVDPGPRCPKSRARVCLQTRQTPEQATALDEGIKV
jgi:hypothetical protein